MMGKRRMAAKRLRKQTYGPNAHLVQIQAALLIVGVILMIGALYGTLLSHTTTQTQPSGIQQFLISAQSVLLLLGGAMLVVGLVGVENVLLFVPGSKAFKTMYGRQARIGTCFILPFILGFLVFMAKPLVESFFMSFNQVVIVPGQGYSMTWAGIGNYKYAFGVDRFFNQALVASSSQMIINTIATLVMSFVIAVILNQEFKGRILARSIFFLTVILSSGVLTGIEDKITSYNIVQGMAQEMAESSGINLSGGLEDLLRTSGIGTKAFDIVFQMIDSIYDIVMASGIQIIIFISGLQTIPHSLYEAANVEGCTAWESFWKITFPMVSPLLMVNCIYTIIDFFMKSDNEVMERIHRVMYTELRFGESAAMSWSYFVIALAFIGISAFIIKKGVTTYE